MYIVTGGAGMIGSAVVWALNEAGIYDILVVDNIASTEKWKNLVNLQYRDYIHKDAFIKRVRSNKFDVHIKGIVHMGACSNTTELDADFLMENNFHYTKDLFLFAKNHGVRFINASSASTYGDGHHGFSDDLVNTKKLQPLNMYGYSKHLFDLWCMNSNALEDVANLKFFNVYGPNEYHKESMKSVVCKAVTQIQDTGTLQLFASDKLAYEHGGQLRDFIYVKDCATLILWFLENKQAHGIFNVGTGKARTWNSLAMAVFAAMDKKVQIKYTPLPKELKGKYQYFTEAQMSWLEKLGCPLSFMSLEDGIKEYVQEYLLRDNPYLSSIQSNFSE